MSTYEYEVPGMNYEHCKCTFTEHQVPGTRHCCTGYAGTIFLLVFLSLLTSLSLYPEDQSFEMKIVEIVITGKKDEPPFRVI